MNSNCNILRENIEKIKNEAAARKTALGYKLNPGKNDDSTHYILSLEQLEILEDEIEKLINKNSELAIQNDNITQCYNNERTYSTEKIQALETKIECIQEKNEMLISENDKISLDKQKLEFDYSGIIEKKDLEVADLKNENDAINNTLKVQKETIEDLYREINKINYKTKNVANTKRNIKPVKTASGFVVLDMQDKITNSKNKGKRNVVIYVETPIANTRDVSAEYILDFIEDQLGGMPYINDIKNNCLRVGGPKNEFVIISVRLPEKVSMQITLKEYQAKIEELYSGRRKKIELSNYNKFTYVNQIGM